MPPRIAALVPEQEGLLGVMPAYLPSAGLACKLVSLFPRNRDRHTHQAVICVFDHENGTPIALMDGTYITADAHGRRRPPWRRGCSRARTRSVARDRRHRRAGALARARARAGA